MRSALSPLTLVRAPTLDEALRHLADDPALVPLAGCTDLYVALNAGTLEPRRFIDLWSLAELRGITTSGEMLRIGALATHSNIIASGEVQQRLPMLVAACREIGGVQIQNRGTIGGNIANGSPAGDTLPVLAAADAVLVLRHHDGERRVPFREFYTGYRSTTLRAGELITAIEVPPVDGVQWFRKVGTRAAQAISKVVIAAVRAAQPRIAIGSVAPVVLRLPRSEALLAEGAPTDDVIRAMETEIAPIDDIRSTARYRRRVAGNLLRRFISETAS
ncbi:xanthine dehydrogenase family protein subunit M [soil metagenome]